MTRIILRNIAAHRALADFFFSVANRVRQPKRVFRSRTQNKEGQTLGGFLSDSGQVLQFIDQSFNRSGKIRHARCVAQPRISAQTSGRNRSSRSILEVLFWLVKGIPTGLTTLKRLPSISIKIIHLGDSSLLPRSPL